MKFAFYRQTIRKRWARKRGRNKWKCTYCRRPMKASHNGGPSARTWDHVVPKREGGTWRVRCCRECNALKGGMPLDAWLAFMEQNPGWWIRGSQQSHIEVA